MHNSDFFGLLCGTNKNVVYYLLLFIVAATLAQVARTSRFLDVSILRQSAPLFLTTSSAAIIIISGRLWTLVLSHKQVYLATRRVPPVVFHSRYGNHPINKLTNLKYSRNKWTNTTADEEGR